MTASDLIATLTMRGIELSADGEKLRFRPVEKMSPFDVEQLRQHKTTILKLLRSERIECRNSYADSRPHAKCDCCGCGESQDVPIHYGQSLRRQCGSCGRFINFPIWYGKTTGQKGQHLIEFTHGEETIQTTDRPIAASNR